MFMEACVAITTDPYKNVSKESMFSLSHNSSEGSSLRSDRCTALRFLGDVRQKSEEHVGLPTLLNG